jgi:hypothetical protein
LLKASRPKPFKIDGDISEADPPQRLDDVLADGIGAQLWELVYRHFKSRQRVFMQANAEAAEA